MELNLYQDSIIWRSERDKRIVRFVRIIAMFMIVIASLWTIVTILDHLFLLTYASLSTAILGFITLKLVKSNRIVAAKFLILLAGTCYFLIATVFASGYGINNGSAHFGFITLALVSYFLMYELKIYREILPILYLTTFFLFHFGYAPFKPMIMLPPEKVELVHKLDIILTLITIYFVTRQFVVEITKSEQALAISADRLEGLIESMLPKSVAERMRHERKTFADEFHECSVLFADIVDFTAWSEKHNPNELVDRLNIIFSRFDDLVEKTNLTKIKTNGDSYMVAAGVPEFSEDHAVVLTAMALEMQKIASEYSEFKFRMGINSGSVVAGIIGKKIFLYDLWGDTVNTASRMESSGETGRVNISGATYELVKNQFNCIYRGKVHAKNKGEIDMYFVESRI